MKQSKREYTSLVIGIVIIILLFATLAYTGIINPNFTGEATRTISLKDSVIAIMGPTSDHISQFVILELFNNNFTYRLYPTNDNPLGFFEEGVGISLTQGDLNNDRENEIIVTSLNSYAYLFPITIINDQIAPLMPTNGDNPTRLTSLTPNGIDTDVIGATATIADFDTKPENKIFVGPIYKTTSQKKQIYIPVYAWNKSTNSLDLESILRSGWKSGATKGISIASGDIDNDGFDEIIIGESFGSNKARIKIFDNEVYSNGSIVTLLHKNMFNNGNGVSVAVGNIDGAPGEEIIIGQGPNGTTNNIRVIKYTGNGTIKNLITKKNILPPGDGMYVSSGDINGDGTEEIIIGQGPKNALNTNQYVYAYNYDTLKKKLKLVTNHLLIPAGPEGILVSSGSPFKFDLYPTCGDGTCSSSVIGVDENETLRYGDYIIKVEEIQPRKMKISINANTFGEHILTVGEAIEFADLYIELIEIQASRGIIRIGENNHICPIDCDE